MKKVIATLLGVILSFRPIVADANMYITYPTEIDLPYEVIGECIDAGEEFDVAPSLLMSLVWQESRGQLDNATQITKLKWFQEGIKATGATNPKTNRRENIRVCAYYLSVWCAEYDDPILATEMWNEGKETALATHNDLKPSIYAQQIDERSQRWSIALDRYFEQERRYENWRQTLVTEN